MEPAQEQIPGIGMDDFPVRNEYVLPSSAESPEEMNRLDVMHEAVTHYLGGKLCLLPLEELEPRKVLELGCGSGAWALQAAAEFPHAHIIAVDVSPLPLRAFPANITFRQLDISRELPLEKNSFDIVHARIVMCHVPNGPDAIKRAAQLVKPGGLLLINDLDMSSFIRTGGPAVRRWSEEYFTSFQARGMDPGLGRHLQGILSALDGFADVNVRKVSLQMRRTNEGLEDSLQVLAAAIRSSFTQAAMCATQRVGIPAHLVKDFTAELESTECTAELDWYFSWARCG